MSRLEAGGHRNEGHLLRQKLSMLERELAEADEALARRIAGECEVARSLQAQLDLVRQERDDLLLRVRTLREHLAAVDDVLSVRARGTSGVVRFGLHQHPREGVVRIAGIMDEFTAKAFAQAAELCQLDPDVWKAQLEEFAPDLLLVESAWHGNDGRWTRKVSHPSRELMGLLDWCKHNDIPTAFWNKEDPVHFQTFIGTARHFEHVFTTDIDCIGRYKTLLGHDRVHLLPFWGEPRLHNPVELFERKDAFCFAGAYYTRYPARQRDFDTMIRALGTLAPIEIFDRNHGKDDPVYMFPEQYRNMIIGTLPYEEIDRAYKGYGFGINLNSVKQSQTMCARRAFDLMLSNTHVVSNYSRALRLMFGDLVTSTDSAALLGQRLAPFFEDGAPVSYRRMHRLLALRKLMREHTTQNRLAQVVEKTMGLAVKRALPSMVVVAAIRDEAGLAHAVASFARHSWHEKRLVIVVADGAESVSFKSIRGRRDTRLFTARDAQELDPSGAWSGKLVAFFCGNDFYGASYLEDAALAFLYSDADVAGKATHYRGSAQGIELVDAGGQYHWQDSLALRRSVASAASLAGSSLATWLQALESRTIGAQRCLALDEFSYVADLDGPLPAWMEEPDIDQGMAMDDIYRQAESIKGIGGAYEVTHGLDAKKLLELFEGGQHSGSVRLGEAGEELVLRSILDEEAHKYLYARRLLPIAELTGSSDVTFNLVTLPGLHVDAVMIFLAEDGERIGHLVKPAGRNHVCPLPDGTVHVRFGLRVLGPGSARVVGLSLQPMPVAGQVPPQLGRAQSLVVTNIYPSAEHLYRNGFVHRRVVGYRDSGCRVDVFALNPKARPHGYEFQGIDVAVGGSEQLESLLDHNPYGSVLVHFLDPTMWASLRSRLCDTRVIVWIHGVEVQPWYRRDFNYATEEERDVAKARSADRMAFWKEVLECRHPNLSFVFVSQYLADGVMEDVGVRLENWQFRIIHNFVDTELFRYEEKAVAKRFKVLSIRPFASRTYANDLSVKAILALSECEEFGSMEFRIVGDGVLFDETLEPLRKFDNVVIERRFLHQEQIAELHRSHGFFLCPTRMDSQGVSRDEAMSSGLVPVTNAVTAIPEFVDGQCGVLADAEDSGGMADGILQLVRDPERFQAMSAAAARRVRAQSGFCQTIAKELALIAPSCESAGTSVTSDG